MRDELLDGIDDLDLGDRPEPFWRRPLLIVISLFFILLIASFSFLDAVIGIVSSKQLESNKLVFSNITIVFENETMRLLQSEYLGNQEREIKACLFGKIAGGNYIIDDVVFPDVKDATVARFAQRGNLTGGGASVRWIM